VYLDLGALHAERIGHRFLVRRLHLGAEIEIATVRAHVGQAVERFHR
jgi:hypothetical protein